MTIRDPAYIPPPTVSITATDAAASENGPDVGTLTVSRSGSTASALNVSYSLSGTATSSDYAALSGSVQIPAGQTSAPIVVTPIADALAEGSETVIATLTANASYVLGTPSSATVTINDPPLNQSPVVALAAHASPATVLGNAAELEAIGADDGGEPALTYTWETTGTPPAVPTFTPNGTNAAQITQVKFTKPGTYQFRVTIRDAAGLSVTSSTSVVVQAGINRLVVSPGNLFLAPGGSRTFTVNAYNQFGEAFTPASSKNWSITGGNATINATTGVVAAGTTAGNGRVSVTWGGLTASTLFTVTNGFSARINFQPAPSPVPAGYEVDSGLVYGVRSNGLSYGWNVDHADLSRDRGINGDQRLDTLIHLHQGANWSIAAPNGTYAVFVSIGDAANASSHTIRVQGSTYWLNQSLAANQYAVIGKMVSVTNGKIVIDQGSAVDKATRINYVEIIQSFPTPTIQLPAFVPAGGIANATLAVTQGATSQTLTLTGGATFTNGSTTMVLTVPYFGSVPIIASSSSGTVNVALNGVPVAGLGKVTVSIAPIVRRADLPASIRYNSTVDLATTVSADLTASKHVIAYVVNNAIANVGNGKIATKSGQITVSGDRQSADTQDFAEIEALLDGDATQVCGRSIKFRVCAHPRSVSLLAKLSDVFTQPSIAMKVRMGNESDTGMIGDLDRCRVSEVIDQQISADELKAVVEHNDNPPFTYEGPSKVGWWMPGTSPTWSDNHSYQGSYVADDGSQGSRRVLQGHMFYCSRCGIDKKPIDNSGFRISRVVNGINSGPHMSIYTLKAAFAPLIKAQLAHPNPSINVQENIPEMKFSNGLVPVGELSTDNHQLPAP